MRPRWIICCECKSIQNTRQLYFNANKSTAKKGHGRFYCIHHRMSLPFLSVLIMGAFERTMHKQYTHNTLSISAKPDLRALSCVIGNHRAYPNWLRFNHWHHAAKLCKSLLLWLHHARDAQRDRSLCVCVLLNHVMQMYAGVLGNGIVFYRVHLFTSLLCVRLFFPSSRHQLHLPSGHPWWDVRAAQTATQSHHVHFAAAGGAGDGVRTDTLSGRVHARGSGDEDQPDGGARAGTTDWICLCQPLRLLSSRSINWQTGLIQLEYDITEYNIETHDTRRHLNGQLSGSRARMFWELGSWAIKIELRFFCLRWRAQCKKQEAIVAEGTLHIHCKNTTVKFDTFCEG